MTPKQAMKQALDALEPFAEEPSERMDAYPCHKGLLPKERCGRCSRAIAAFIAMTDLRDTMAEMKEANE